MNPRLPRKAPFKAITCLVITVFSLTTILPPQRAQAQSIVSLPLPGVMVPPSLGFVPALMRGIKLFPENPLRFDFIIDTL